MSTLKEKIKDVDIEKGMSDKLEKIADDYAIEFVEWLTNEKSKYAIMYGQKIRFSTFKKDYTTEELLKIFKKEKGY